MLIVDGHNVAFADPEAHAMLDRADPAGAGARVLLLAELYASATKQQATVVFDGTGGGEVQAEADAGGVRCRFSGAGRSADVEILRIARGSTGRREICLVTNDRSLSVAARRLGVRIMGVAAFLRETAALARKKKAPHVFEPAAKHFGPSPAEVAYWLTVFSDDDVAAIEKEQCPERRKRKK